MMKSIEGIYRNGKIELVEAAPEGASGRVIVTFLSGTAPVNLGDRGVDPQQAADLRHRLSTFADDWQQPEMDAYDAL